MMWVFFKICFLYLVGYVGVYHSLIFRDAIDSTVHSTTLKLVGCIVKTSRASNEKMYV